jgi:hypothetical protein
MEFDCSGARSRMLLTAGYSAHRGEGTIVDSGDPNQGWGAVDGDYSRTLWKAACDPK